MTMHEGGTGTGTGTGLALTAVVDALLHAHTRVHAQFLLRPEHSALPAAAVLSQRLGGLDGRLWPAHGSIVRNLDGNCVLPWPRLC